LRLLLDTHCWLWAFLEPAKLRRGTQALIRDLNNEVYLSVASCWEISIKAALGKLRLPVPPPLFVPARLSQQHMSALAITVDHALAVHGLPSHHSDPFDRMLVAQAQIEGLTIVTADPVFARYSVPTIKA
jgi:PIN domain nuclease of toxin-antitoxin system